MKKVLTLLTFITLLSTLWPTGFTSIHLILLFIFQIPQYIELFSPQKKYDEKIITQKNQGLEILKGWNNALEEVSEAQKNTFVEIGSNLSNHIELDKIIQNQNKIIEKVDPICFKVEEITEKIIKENFHITHSCIINNFKHYQYITQNCNKHIEQMAYHIANIGIRPNTESLNLLTLEYKKVTSKMIELQSFVEQKMNFFKSQHFELKSNFNTLALEIVKMHQEAQKIKENQRYIADFNYNMQKKFKKILLLQTNLKSEKNLPLNNRLKHSQDWLEKTFNLTNTVLSVDDQNRQPKSPWSWSDENSADICSII